MLATLSALAALACLSHAAPAAAPSPQLASRSGMTFTVEQIPNPRRQARNGPHALQHSYRKHGLQMATSQLFVDGSAVARPEAGNAEWLTPVSVGTPAKLLHLTLDTGSSDLWVYADGDSSHGGYDPSKSKTAVLLEATDFDITYGDGSGASGFVYYDTVAVGPCTVTSQAVEAATSIGSAFTADADLDGIMGMGGKSLNQVYPTQQNTFFGNLAPSLAYPIFATKLVANGPGAVDFGYTNNDHFTGGIAWANVDRSSGFWVLDVSGYYVGYDSHKLAMQCIVDSGTTLMVMPSDLVSDYYAQVPSAYNDESYGGWVFECDEDLPILTLDIGNIKRSVDGSIINYASAFTSYGKNFCYGGLQANADGAQYNILGDAFLMSTYAIFDAGRDMIGFATQS